MADVINLRLARKARQRSDSGKIADTNRVKFGQTKAERQAHEQEAARTARLLDGAKREPD